jgi:hypothetical protein
MTFTPINRALEASRRLAQSALPDAPVDEDERPPATPCSPYIASPVAAPRTTPRRQAGAGVGDLVLVTVRGWLRRRKNARPQADGSVQTRGGGRGR